MQPLGRNHRPRPDAHAVGPVRDDDAHRPGRAHDQGRAARQGRRHARAARRPPRLLARRHGRLFHDAQPQQGERLHRPQERCRARGLLRPRPPRRRRVRQLRRRRAAAPEDRPRDARRDQPEDHHLLGHRLRRDRPRHAAAGVRPGRAGHGRRHEHHRPARRRARARRHPDRRPRRRHLRRDGRARRAAGAPRHRRRPARRRVDARRADLAPDLHGDDVPDVGPRARPDRQLALRPRAVQHVLARATATSSSPASAMRSTSASSTSCRIPSC